MKLLRVGAPNHEKPALLHADGTVRDLSSVIQDFAGCTLQPRALQMIRHTDATRLPIVAPETRVGPCVAGTRNFVAVGLNYADHAAEAGVVVPSEPVLFNKAPTCIVGAYDDVVLPRTSEKTDWEVELAVVIGSSASYISESDALSVIAGYCICNDLSERAFQLERGGQWFKGKSCPTFGPIGPWLVTPDEITDPQNLSMWLNVNGKRMQSGSTRTMVFSVAHLVSYVSQFMQLEPGDIITTGTPPGVGMGMKPPRYLSPGDVLTLGIDGLGEQCHRVIAATTRPAFSV